MIEISALGPPLIPAVRAFFARIDRPEIRAHFSPHAFTRADADRLCRYEGADLYFAALQDGRMVAYGMLRGWDEGYAIPSLGLCVDPACHRQGLGALMMAHLVRAARVKAAPGVLLKVKRDNPAAIALYRKVGFALTPLDDAFLRGTLDLTTDGSHAGHRRP